MNIKTVMCYCAGYFLLTSRPGEAELTVHGRITFISRYLDTDIAYRSITRARCPTNHVQIICSLLMSANEQQHSQSFVLCAVELARRGDLLQ